MQKLVYLWTFAVNNLGLSYIATQFVYVYMVYIVTGPGTPVRRVTVSVPKIVGSLLPLGGEMLNVSLPFTYVRCGLSIAAL